MKAVLLAAGNSSRFYPFNTHHKSLQSILGKTVIEHTLRSIHKSDVNEVIIVCNDESEFKKSLESFNSEGMSIQYCVQGEARGMGDALLCAAEYIDSDFFLLSPHRLDFETYFQAMIEKKKESDAVLVVHQEDDLSHFGKVELDGDRVIGLTEKPADTLGNGYRLLSTYLLTKSFLDILKSTPLEQYSFERALADYCKSHTAKVIVVEDEPFTFKFPWNLLDVKNYAIRNISRKISEQAQIAESAKIIGEVVVEDGARIFENAVIKGPCYIGKNTVVGDFTLIRENTVLEEGVVVGVFSEIKNSLIGKNTHIHSGYIGDSVVGENCRIGADICVSNARLDRAEIFSIVGNKKVNTHKKSLGVIMGDEVKCGIRVGTMPGIIIGSNAIIGPATTVMKNVERDTTVYSDHQNTSKKNE